MHSGLTPLSREKWNHHQSAFFQIFFREQSLLDTKITKITISMCISSVFRGLELRKILKISIFQGFCPVPNKAPSSLRNTWKPSTNSFFHTIRLHFMRTCYHFNAHHWPNVKKMVKNEKKQTFFLIFYQLFWLKNLNISETGRVHIPNHTWNTNIINMTIWKHQVTGVDPPGFWIIYHHFHLHGEFHVFYSKIIR